MYYSCEHRRNYRDIYGEAELMSLLGFTNHTDVYSVLDSEHLSLVV